MLDMNRNLIVCSDGTGNTFEQDSSNVSRLIKSLDLRCRPDAKDRLQIAFYDQGVGTNLDLVGDAHDYSVFNREAEMLKILPVPKTSLWMRSRISLWVNKAFGWGLRENIKEMVHALSTHYEPDDQIYLFGFSRGAFTVRALAGFLYRCWLPSKNNDNFDQWFDRAFDYYTPFEVSDEVREFRACGVEVKIKFLGIWDTVKSYGGIIPIAWSHLRHNPIIEQVRHALALDEKRTYFQHTTWGSLKEEIKGIPIEPDDRYKEQVVKEVWFRGYHSDIGGWYTKQKSAEERDAGEISLLWILGEAEQHGLRLTEQGKLLFKNKDDPKKEIKVHDS